VLPIAIFNENIKLKITTDLLLGPSRSFGLTVLGNTGEGKGEGEVEKRERLRREEG
jgi:hypothetical protein